ncbi:MAG: DEAD/DEAH box helicase family protein, partial [Armatimonadetes bacterium]|nr:DEAD/DEAH box helicase family protein [Armatimonadota bacterium]
GEALERFAHEYRWQYGRELKLGREELPHADRHLVGLLSPDDLAARLGGEREEWARLLATVAKRQGGRFAAGERKQIAEAVEKLRQLQQMRLFADRHLATSRTTIGRTAEQQLRRIWSRVAPNFDPRRPVSIPTDVRMDGKYAPQQRAIKLVERMGRVGMHLATGAGKTLVGLGSFAHLASQGKVKRGIFVVPAKQGGQWGSEALRFLEPGRWRHFVAAGATAEERRRAYADPDTHMVIVGHQALREDLTWAVAQVHFGGDEQAARQALSAQAPKGASDEEREQFERQQRQLVQSAVRQLGWSFDFSMLDEGHDALNRKGKPNSRLANALDAFTEPHRYHINATATPVKNDVSEVFDLLHKLRPDRYPLSRRREFMRKYGTTDIAGVAEALRREVAPYFYARQVDTGTRRREHKRVVSLSPEQRRLYRDVMQAYRTARQSRQGSPAWQKAMERLLPPGELEGLTPEQRRARLERAARYLGSVRDHALARVVYGNDSRLKPEHVGAFQDVLEVAKSHARDDFDGGQLPGVVFAHSPGVARRLAKFLRQQGVRAGVIDGTLSSEEAEGVRQKFFPQGTLDPSDPRGSAERMRKGAQYDVLVCTDAASHGLNLQRAAWLYHVDAPYTAKTHQQRNGRIDRIGQLHGEVHVYDAHHDAPYDRRRRQILQQKYPLTETFQKPYELLDQDETDTAERLVEQRDDRLGAATHVAAIPNFELAEARGAVPRAPVELLAQAARGEVELTPQQEYAAQEAAGQQLVARALAGGM